MIDFDIREIMKVNNLTSKNLADITGVKQGTVESWKNNQRNVSKTAMILIEKHLTDNVVNETKDSMTEKEKDKILIQLQLELNNAKDEIIKMKDEIIRVKDDKINELKESNKTLI